MWSVKEAARLMGISEQRLRKLLAEGRVKGKKLDGTWVVLELGYEHKRGYNPSKGGHAPGHLREAFQNYIALVCTLSENESLPKKAFIDGERPVPINWLIGQLWNCTDVLPSTYRDLLKDMGMEDCWTYSRAARAIRNMLDEEAKK